MRSPPRSRGITRSLDFEPEVLIASYHGIPQSYFKRGDPYPCHCWKTTRLLRERLGWSEGQADYLFPVAFRPGRMDAALYGQDAGETWRGTASNRLPSSIRALSPTAWKRSRKLPSAGAEIFHHNGGVNFTHIPCLNDSDEGMKVIETLVRRELQGWI